MTVSMALIVKNEERCLARCLESIKGAVDEIIILDTGSVDATKAIARRYTENVFDYEWRKDFAAARQFAFDRATSDWVAWVDADDVVIRAGRIRQLIESAPPQVAGFYWRYIYQRDSWGNPNCEFWRERCVRNDGRFRWVGRIHETLVPDEPCQMVRTDEVLIEHRSDPTLNSAKLRRNLEILEEEYASTSNPSPRLLFYLASEYESAANVQAALKFYKQYLHVADWNDERYLVQTRLARLYRGLKRYDSAINADLKALKICPHWSGAYFGLAESYYYLEDWHKVIHWTDVGRAMPEPETIHILNPLEYRYNWIIYYTNALYRVGAVREALEWTERALKLRPDDKWHQQNFFCFAQALRTEQEQSGTASDVMRPTLRPREECAARVAAG